MRIARYIGFLLPICLPGLIAAPLSWSPLSAPEEIYNIGPAVQVSRDRANIVHREVILAADPGNPDRLLAASMTTPDSKDPNHNEVAVYASRDGGKTWKLTVERKTAGDTIMIADPSIEFGSNGTATMVCFGGNPFMGKAYTEFLHSPDGGLSWDVPRVINGAVDRPFLVVDRTQGRYSGRIYCVRTVGSDRLVISVSDDHGKTFKDGEPSSLLGGITGLALPAVVSDGTLVVPYPTRHSKPSEIRVVRSSDGGKSVEKSKAIATYHDDIKGLPILKADTSNSPYRDQLYLVWADAVEKGTEIKIAISRDKGVTWSEPFILSEQKEAGKARDYHAYLPAIAVNKAGVVGVSWYDTRDIAVNKEGWHGRFRASIDGGKTWLPSSRISAAGSEFLKGEKYENIFAGDTAGLAADGKGVFHVLWVNNSSGVLQAWTVPIEVLK